MRNRLEHLCAVAAAVLVPAVGCAPTPTLSSGEMRGLAMGLVANAATRRDNPVLRAQAIETLQEIEGAKGSHWFRDAIDDGHPGVRFAACMALGTVGHKESEAKIRERLGDPDPSVRIAAMYALRRMGDKGFVEEWAQIVRTHPEPTVRSNAVMALGLLGEREAVPLLKRVREDEDIGVRLQSLESMGLLGSGEAVKQLIFYANGAHGDRQAFAILALGRIGDPVCLETLRYCLGKGPHIESKLAAARSLGMLGHDDGYRLAAWALTWNQPDAKVENDPPANQVMRVRTMAAFALGAIGKQEALPGLVRFMQQEGDPRVQMAAASAILHILHRAESTPKP